MDEDRNTTGLYGDHHDAPYDIARENRTQLLPKMVFQTSYTRNTSKEDLVLATVENFRAQYLALYPTRAPLLLAPKNECSCRKFIATFIRPTLLRHDDLYDWHTIGKYLANYVRYEPLDDPEVLPTRLTSPTTTLLWQVGNSIEMSVLLASLLIGAGYNAYVCVGYAEKSICDNDQSGNHWQDTLPAEVNPDDVVLPPKAPTSKYMQFLKERPKLVSQFEIEQRERDRQRNEDDMRIDGFSSTDGGASPQNGGGDDDEFGADDEDHDQHGGGGQPGTHRRSSVSRDGGGGAGSQRRHRLVHAWVLLLPTMRPIEEPKTTLAQRLNLIQSATFRGTVSTCVVHESELENKPTNEHKFINDALFIEPSTGAFRKAKESGGQYHAIESVFNHENYFVNMNPDTPAAKLKVDQLRDLSLWERIFLKDPTTGAQGAEDAQESDKRANLVAATSDVGESGDQILDLPVSWVSPITLSPVQYANRYPGRHKIVHYSDATVELYADYSEPDLRILVVSVPDGLSHHDQTHIFFKHRADKLRRRSIFPQERSRQPRLIHDWFEPGRMHEASHRVEGLRELIQEPGVHRTMRFFWKSRDDGLARREEHFFNEHITVPMKIKEFYKGRTDDFLVYRGASYELPRDAAGGIGMQYGGGGGGGSSGPSTKEHRVEPVKMSEKFARNPSVEIDKDLMKRVFVKPQTAEGEIWVKYHYRPNTITHGQRLYPRSYDRERDVTAVTATSPKDGGREAADVQPQVVLMSGMTKPRDADLLNELRQMVEKEGECLSELRGRAEEAKDILAQLERDQRDNRQRISVYDTLRGRAKESEAEVAQRKAEEQRRAESRKDYLAPFIAKQENMAKLCKGDYTNVKLTAEMARKVRDEAIADLKERLIERGHIMQARLDREREDLMRRQMTFQKNMDTADGGKDAEEFARFSKEATWRIRILEERLSNYIKYSAEKYRQLADRLANDRRLAVLYPSGD